MQAHHLFLPKQRVLHHQHQALVLQGAIGLAARFKILGEQGAGIEHAAQKAIGAGRLAAQPGVVNAGIGLAQCLVERGQAHVGES